MTAPLTFPGHVPNVLRPQSAGWWTGATGTKRRIIVIRIEDEQALCMLGPLPDREAETAKMVAHDPDVLRHLEASDWCGCWLPLTELSLDLTDATGRTHLAWWVAEKLGRCRHEIASVFDSYGDFIDEAIPGWDWDDDSQWGEAAYTREELADGSWRNGAQALRCVALHLAGLTDD